MTSGGDYYSIMVYDDPKQRVIYRHHNGRLFMETGFRYGNITVVTIPASSLVMWYKFTDEGMQIGYYANTSNVAVQVPTPGHLYYNLFHFSFGSYQMKMYVDCIDFKMYCDNNFPYLFDFSVASKDECINRIWNLKKLEILQFKAFKALTFASVFCLPYNFFNTYKFDFNHIIYNRDGSLKPSSKWYPSMFVDGGELIPRYYPQPTTITN